MAAALTLAGTAAALDASPAVLIGTVVAAVIIIQRHRGNLTRLLAGTERRVGERLT
jgi:glycerol-3-phosphate acyltransferase PlsY